MNPISINLVLLCRARGDGEAPLSIIDSRPSAYNSVLEWLREFVKDFLSLCATCTFWMSSISI